MKLPNRIAVEAMQAKVKLGYLPDIMNPKSFSEHILYNKMLVRNRLLVITTDKVEVSEYVKYCGLGELLIENYYVTQIPETIPFDDLPEQYMIKPNQLSGSLIYVNGKPDKSKIIFTCHQWLKVTHYGKSRFVWCTSQIKPRIIVQKIIDKCPLDYRFHMIHGRCAWIGIYKPPFLGSVKRTNTNYDINWNKLPFTWNKPLGGDIDKPLNLDRMIEIAEKLSRPFPYVRVDLYNIKGKIYFGELTHYPNSGSGRFYPESWDYKFGKLFTEWQEQ